MDIICDDDKVTTFDYPYKDPYQIDAESSANTINQWLDDLGWV